MPIICVFWKLWSFLYLLPMPWQDLGLNSNYNTSYLKYKGVYVYELHMPVHCTQGRQFILFLSSQSATSGTKIYSLTQHSFTAHECHWHILVGNDKRINSHCLTGKKSSQNWKKIQNKNLTKGQNLWSQFGYHIKVTILQFLLSTPFSVLIFCAMNHTNFPHQLPHWFCALLSKMIFTLFPCHYSNQFPTTIFHCIFTLIFCTILCSSSMPVLFTIFYTCDFGHHFRQDCANL